jgi:hypothetical protein
MLHKIALAILVVALGLFIVSSVGLISAKILGDGAVAWARDSTPDVNGASEDGSSDVIQPVPQPNALPPDVHGSWCGSINDIDFGPGTISLAVKQKRGKLSGSWSDTLGGNGKFKGKINGDTITATLTQRGTKCKVAMVGTLVSPDEASGTYSIFGCRASDGGTFDITRPSC